MLIYCGLILSQIHAALAHALANPEEIEQALREEEQAGKTMVAEKSAA